MGRQQDVKEAMKKAFEDSQKKETLAVAEPVAVVAPSPQKPLDIRDFTVVDGEALIRMFYALGTERAEHYEGMPGIRRIGRILGAKNYQEEIKIWQKVKRFVMQKEKANENQSQDVAHGQNGGSDKAGDSIAAEQRPGNHLPEAEPDI